MNRKEREDFKGELEGFTGTEHYYTCGFPNGKIKMTDGAKYLAEKAGAYWLMDIIAIANTAEYSTKYPFQIWELVVADNKSAAVYCFEDSGQPYIYKQEIKYTDFPLDCIKLYCIDNIILLPSEY